MKLIFIILKVIIFGSIGQAQDYTPGYVPVMDPNNALVLSQNYLSIRNLEISAERLSKSPSTEKANGPVVNLNSNCKVPKQMASHFPLDKQTEAEKVFQDLLRKYRQLEAQLEIPKANLGGAFALFIGSQYSVANNVDLTDSEFQALVKQFNFLLKSLPGIDSLSDDDKQCLYENFVIIGMFTVATRGALKQKPNIELKGKLENSAKDYLKKFLNATPEQVSITINGLLVR